MIKKLLSALVISGLFTLPLAADSPQPFFNAAVTNAAVSVKNTAGTIYGYSIGNTGAAVCFIQVFNATAGSVTLGTTAPLFAIALNATSTATGMFGPIPMTAAISIAATTTANGSTACAATQAVTLLYL